ncbi:RluA family pseudouridine synthase ['Fragaria x ananassa' phyllody phytoplasma]|uniref:Pseudouridine synthase n=1 Tax='Fragaria x ananassa' phyllody phytoplasma TaxID=2358428 RepID=A0ABS5K3M7_9MOLU|nr:RluA family pseudouridine synthase ['Fragaria x ananassa' phyllody phytoplasma]MBS2126511.1 RluA family pseudouridine synthase ['Fragaria x ananassa' phyllody phytoplasma]
MILKQDFIVFQNESLQRLDHFLTIKTTFNKSKCQQLILSKQVLVNNNPSKKSYLLKTDDIVTIDASQSPPIPKIQQPYNLNLEIIYEDSYLAVINKPANLIVHPSLSFQGLTLVNGLLYQIKTLSYLDTLRPGIVHRLDKNTTGLMLIAKNNDVNQKLQQAFKNRTIKKIYQTLIEGFLEDLGTIDLPIARHPHNRLKMTVLAQGKKAITHFTTLKRFHNYSLMECVLETGRKHQLRAHFAHLKHPIVGDQLYGSQSYNNDLGQFLHAQKIMMQHPITQLKMVFEAPLPFNFKQLIANLEN